MVAPLHVGFTCAYTPLPLIDAVGLVPYRILPVGEAGDRAGGLLHDNLCPHVKRVLDRGLAGDLPPLAGLLIMNSCDTMRRLVDGWRRARPDDPLLLVELPVTSDRAAVDFLAEELERAAETVAGWAARSVDLVAVAASIEGYRGLAERLAAATRAPLSRGELQRLYNLSVTLPVDRAMAEISAAVDAGGSTEGGVGLYLFGNVMPDPAAYDLFEQCGGRIVGDDLCTGDRQHPRYSPPGAAGELWQQLSRDLLDRPVCARTMTPSEPDRLADQLIAGVRRSNAAGAVAHIAKFCDPYLARLPQIAARLERESIPLLVLEGDCTTRSLGQQATRIEAFVEMLG